MNKILIVDDDPGMLGLISTIMENEGHQTLKAQSGLEALSVAHSNKPDLCILDVSMPEMDGVALCKSIRTIADLADVPIIFVTAHVGKYTVTDALEAGGDDFIRKPFANRELAARVRAHLRRYMQNDGQPFIQIRSKQFRIFVNQTEVVLTQQEFELFHFLGVHANDWFSTQDLLHKVWDYPVGIGDPALVRNHVRNIRQKIEENPDKPIILQSRHGRGYAICANVSFV